MENREEKPRFLDNIKWILQGFRVLMRLTPSYLPTLLGQSFITAFVPMMQLFFTARILNELAGGRDAAVITRCAVLTVLISFAFSALKSVLTREVNLSAFWFAYADMLGMEAEQFAKMDFPYTENTEISEKLAVMDTKARGNGLGLINLYQMARSLSADFFSLIFAGVLLSGTFNSNAFYEHTFVTTPYASLLLVLLIAIMLAMNMLFRRKEKKMLD